MFKWCSRGFGIVPINIGIIFVFFCHKYSICIFRSLYLVIFSQFFFLYFAVSGTASSTTETLCLSYLQLLSLGCYMAVALLLFYIMHVQCSLALFTNGKY